MLAIRCRIHAHPETIGQAAWTRTRPPRTYHPARTRNATASAVFVVCLIRNARSVALGLTDRAGHSAHSPNTQRSRRTSVVACPTMRTPRHRIHTSSPAFGKCSRTTARSSHTHLSTRANHTASAAMVVVALQADTRPAAIALTTRTGRHTRTTRTHLPARASLTARPTMRPICGGIHTRSPTRRQTARAGT